ncbi:hypothetical protein H6P81_004408 [Aristolochia fimbriata]|uniref:phosphoglycerate kinase n=1 Tax=Aristolochia fimbriata TaxID=158543 RepID=A0AAV7FFA8_ARIFI|nr:hypothetical protein H6P81_004408 [Aristolochia fimbriata]
MLLHSLLLTCNGVNFGLEGVPQGCNPKIQLEACCIMHALSKFCLWFLLLLLALQGCPKGVTQKFSLKPLVPRLSELLDITVQKADDCIGEEVEKLVASLPEAGVLLLENVRFYKEEEKNDPEFAKKILLPMH